MSISNLQVQHIAVETIKYIKNEIIPGMTLSEIRKLCENKMLSLGADSFWYYNIGALIFADEETTISVSGRKYKTSEYIVKNDDIITIDLSPQIRRVWGDYARTIIIENGKTVENIEDIKNTQWKNGLMFEEQLHKHLTEFSNPNTTFEDLYYEMNNMICENGFVNLDFNNNLGHSICHYKTSRIYIEKNNKRKLSSVKYFTFEPHIALPNGNYGYKKENIYSFENGILKSLK